MKETVRTLLIDANGLTWKSILADTLLRRRSNVCPTSSFCSRVQQTRIGHRLLGQRNDALSYVLDWRDAICERSELDVEVCNITNLCEYQKSLRELSRYPLIIILHSATGDSISLLRKRAKWFQERRGKLVVFVGNEYNLLKDKLDFLKAVKADFICSQLPAEAARWLYGECRDSMVLSMPHALNPRVYFPKPNCSRRIDLGFIGDFYHNLIGDMERTHLVHFFQDHGEKYGLTCDVRSRRLPRFEWAEYLRICNGILGAESGTYYLDRTGEKVEGARRYLRTHRGASFDEVHRLFFKGGAEGISGKTISSRHFEPIGTKTCQVLVEGNYNGILKANEHYIAVRKDLSNMEEVIRRFKDEGYRSSMVNETHEYALSLHTYKHRIDSLLRSVL